MIYENCHRMELSKETLIDTYNVYWNKTIWIVAME